MSVFGVITKIDEDGNYAAAIQVRAREGNGPYEQSEDVTRLGLFVLGMPVFALGEILVLDDEHGREIGGDMRKPSKWFVECEHFDDIEAAIARSREVTTA